MKIEGKVKKITLFVTIFLVLATLAILITPLLTDTYKKNSFKPEDVVDYSTERPLEKKIPKYDVPDNQPKSINIESIDAFGYIQMVGIDQHGRIAVPTNVNLAGWYVENQKPGERGLSIISAHKDGLRNKGLFYSLDKVKVSDVVIIEYGDGTIYEFEVVDRIIVTENEAQNLIYRKNENIDVQLNLVSCGGKFDRKERRYLDRVIVTTKLKN